MLPSERELELLKALWSTKGLSAREIHECVSERLKWSASSTRKTLDRMVEKGSIAIDYRHGVKVYVAQVSKVSVVAMFSKDFMRRVLESTEPIPSMAFTGSSFLNETEIEELEELLAEGVSDD